MITRETVLAAFEKRLADDAMANSIPETSDALLTRNQKAEAPTEAGSPGNAKTLTTKSGRRETDIHDDRVIVAARLARAIGRGRDPIYHGTRFPEKVLRGGKLMPHGGAVSFSRSPEVAAYFAHLIGSEADGYSPALLVLDRNSLRQVYRLEATRYDEKWDDEREEAVYGRTINFRRHLLGVVRESDISKILGPPELKFFPPTWSFPKDAAFPRKSVKLGERLVHEGRARVRDIIISEREQLSNARSPVGPAVTSPSANRRPEAQRQCAGRRR
jgi:hypothetical protein